MTLLLCCFVLYNNGLVKSKWFKKIGGSQFCTCSYIVQALHLIPHWLSLQIFHFLVFRFSLYYNLQLKFWHMVISDSKDTYYSII